MRARQVALRHKLSLGQGKRVTSYSMFLSLLRYAKSRDVLVLVSSSAGTGISKVLKRPRLADKLAVKLFDRKVRRHVLFTEIKKIKSLKG